MFILGPSNISLIYSFGDLGPLVHSLDHYSSSWSLVLLGIGSIGGLFLCTKELGEVSSWTNSSLSDLWDTLNCVPPLIFEFNWPAPIGISNVYMTKEILV